MEFILTLVFTALCVLFGPHRLLFFIVRWYDENYSRKSRNELYDRVGVPCAGVITHRQFQTDGTMLSRYAYRPPSNPNMVYIREYMREANHQSYPWGDEKRILVVLVVPGHRASGLEVRKLSEPAETYWRRISICSLVSLSFLWSMKAVQIMENWISISFGLLFVLSFGCVSPESDRIFEKFDVNDLSEVEEDSMLVEGDGEVSPTFVQYLSRREILPSLESAEAEIRNHMELLRNRNVGSFEQDLIRYYTRCDTPATDDSNPPNADSTLIEATVVVDPSTEHNAGREESGDLEMAPQFVEQLPLLAAETVGIQHRSK